MDKKKVILIGPSFGRYVNSIAHGFERNGWDTSKYVYVDPPFDLSTRFLYRQLPNHGIKIFRKREMDRILRALREQSKKSNLLVILKGDRIGLSQYEEMVTKCYCPVVLWLMDPIDSVSEGMERSNLAAMTFLFERSDVPRVRAKGSLAEFIHLAADTRWYRPLSNPKREWDISFVGALYEERLELMEKLSDRLSKRDISMRVMGSYFAMTKPWEVLGFRRKYPHLWPYLRHSHMVSHEAINWLNNNTRICLNIMRNDSSSGLNMRIYETCASGALQLVKRHGEIVECFDEGREIIVFNDEEEATDKIKYYLAHENQLNRVARAGLKRVIKCHTITVRVAELTETLAKNGIL